MFINTFTWKLPSDRVKEGMRKNNIRTGRVMIAAGICLLAASFAMAGERLDFDQGFSVSAVLNDLKEKARTAPPIASGCPGTVPDRTGNSVREVFDTIGFQKVNRGSLPKEQSGSDSDNASGC